MTGYSKTELEEMVRVERLQLKQELIPLERRIKWIYNRLADLESTDGLIEGLDHGVYV